MPVDRLLAATVMAALGLGVSGCFASHAPTDGGEPDPRCTVPQYAWLGVEPRFADYFECSGYSDSDPDRRDFVFNTYRGRCEVWNAASCPCPIRTCAPPDHPRLDCLFSDEEREGGRRPPGTDETYCYFASRSECECACLGLCE